MPMDVLKNGLYILCVGVLYHQVQKYINPKLPTHFGGDVSPGWEKVAEVFRQQVEQGIQPGGTFNVYYKGEHVVNVWGGYADVEAAIPWEMDTLSVWRSVTKFMCTLIVQMLVERDHINVNNPVAKYWPEFAQGGKDRITVEQLLSHQAGIAYVDEKFSFFDIRDNPQKVGDALAAQVPNWEPGKHSGYHAFTYGLLIDQIVRRVDHLHRNLSTFFEDEIARSFGIDFFIGLPLEENYRTARIYPATWGWEKLIATQYWITYALAFSADSFASKMKANPPEMSRQNIRNHPRTRQVPSGSSNGFGTGSAVAKLMGILANGGTFNGQRLLSESGIRYLASPIVSGQDFTWFLTKENLTFGPGTLIYPSPKDGNTFGHCGMGGQMAYADPSLKLGWSYLTNHLTVYTLGDRPATNQLKKTMYDCASSDELD